MLKIIFSAVLLLLSVAVNAQEEYRYQEKSFKETVCDETNSVSIENGSSLIIKKESGPCYKVDTRKYTNLKMYCEGRKKPDWKIEFEIRGCDGNVFAIYHPCAKRKERYLDKWVNIPVGGRCPVFIKNMVPDFIGTIRLVESDKELSYGPTGTIGRIDYPSKYKEYENNKILKKEMMDFVYRHFEDVKSVYVKLLRQNSRAENYSSLDVHFLFEIDENVEKIKSIKWGRDRGLEDFVTVYKDFNNNLEKFFRLIGVETIEYQRAAQLLKKLNDELNDNMKSEDDDERLISISISFEPYGFQIDYPTGGLIDASTQAEKNTNQPLNSSVPGSCKELSDKVREMLAECTALPKGSQKRERCIERYKEQKKEEQACRSNAR